MIQRRGGDDSRLLAAAVRDVDFPAEALKVEKLKEIRLELTYIPSPYTEETVNFTVSIGGQ